jgi:hypothetical protein
VIDIFVLFDTDPFDIYQTAVDVHQSGKIDRVAALEADSFRRLTGTQDRLQELEHRYERMKLVTAALWQLLKAHTGLTDADLKQYIEKVDLADGKLDGKIARKGGAMDCPHCSRRILKTAVVCPWCSKRLKTGDAFEAT